MEAKRSQLEGQHGMVGLTDAKVIRRISREEWRLHHRRRTRGAEESTLPIQDLLETFGGPAGRNILDIPLDPDTPDEAAAIESLGEDEDEVIEEEVEDPTLFKPDTLSCNTPSRTELRPCKLAQCQSPGGGHLQPALPTPPKRRAVRGDPSGQVLSAPETRGEGCAAAGKWRHACGSTGWRAPPSSKRAVLCLAPRPRAPHPGSGHPVS
ncbi:hypothetical protein FQN60_005281 [Etheostoma spectabile]|uniref:Uncharacterized protein n=1 Tax=Etheostoma spectabile TaxID=54343 RepID=A0A5J5C9C0_9PERO|nr:hypothetical protein FQN60_005281 [Etheostoma spectabile]